MNTILRDRKFLRKQDKDVINSALLEMAEENWLDDLDQQYLNLQMEEWDSKYNPWLDDLDDDMEYEQPDDAYYYAGDDDYFEPDAWYD
jgi:hypothetical protein